MKKDTVYYTWKTSTLGKQHLSTEPRTTLCGTKVASKLNAFRMQKDRSRKLCTICEKRSQNKEIKEKLDKMFVRSNDFLKSKEWREARYDALKKNNGCCELCGRSKHDGVVLNVDHIKPRSKRPDLALKQSNLQVLCGGCNHGKGNRDETDWREPSLAALMGETIE